VGSARRFPRRNAAENHAVYLLWFCSPLLCSCARRWWRWWRRRWRKWWRRRPPQHRRTATHRHTGEGGEGEGKKLKSPKHGSKLLVSDPPLRPRVGPQAGVQGVAPLRWWSFPASVPGAAAPTVSFVSPPPGPHQRKTGWKTVPAPIAGLSSPCRVLGPAPSLADRPRSLGPCRVPVLAPSLANRLRSSFPCRVPGLAPPARPRSSSPCRVPARKPQHLSPGRPFPPNKGERAVQRLLPKMPFCNFWPEFLLTTRRGELRPPGGWWRTTREGSRYLLLRC
jgi:hypothetical protein